MTGPQPQDDARALGRGTAWVLGGQALRFGCQAVALVLVARSLGPEGFGWAAAAAAAGQLLATLHLGYGDLAIAEAAQAAPGARPRLGGGLAALILLGPPLILLAALALGDLPGGGLALLPATLLLTSEVFGARWLDYLGQVCQATRRLDLTARMHLLWGLGRLVAAVLLVLGSPVAGEAELARWAWLSCGTALLVALGATFWLRHGIDLSQPFAGLFTQARRALAFSLAGLGTAVLFQADKLLLAGLAGPGATGHYGAANRLTLMATMPVGALAVAGYRGQFADAARGATAVTLGLGRMLRGGLALALLALFGLLVAAWLLPWILGEAWRPAVPLILALLPLPLLRALQLPFGQALNAAGRPGLRGLLHGLAALLAVLLCLVLIPGQGALGASLAIILAHACLAVALYWAWRRSAAP